MADKNQERGRRRPRSPLEENTGEEMPSTSSRRSPTEQPSSKNFKKESGSPESVRQKRDISEQSTSRHASEAGKAPERRPEQRANRYEIVHTRPSDVQTKKGSEGGSIRLQANYFRLITKPNWRIYQYCVVFEPEFEERRVRGGILWEHREMLGGYLYDGKQLFSTTKLEKEATVVTGKSKRDVGYKITINYVGVISMTQWQSLQILNLILRRSMEGLKMQLVGRNFYDAHEKIELRDHNLQLWPGYETSIRQHENDILLCAQTTFKVMRTETIYDMLVRISRNSNNFQEEFRRTVLGLIVLTDYNNKTYRINDVDFNQTPKATFEMKGKQTSFIDYYSSKYNIRIRDTKQPLLISKAKDVAQSARGNEIVILIPELCRATGLTDSMRSNFQLMRSMADYTRMNPDRRIERLRQFNRRLQQVSESVKVLKNWNMKLDESLVEVTGRVIEPQKIVFKDNKKFSAGEKTDWSHAFRNNSMLTTPSRGLDRWAVIAPNRNGRELGNFIESLFRVASGMGLRMNNPREAFIYDDRNTSYVQALEECSRYDPQLILCLVPNNNVERYNTIKKRSCIDRAIPTQVITLKTASNQRGLMSVATKVAIQINCKLGYTPWMIELPLSGLMTIGYNMAKSTRERSKAYGALVASMDLQKNSTFYSTVAECNAFDIMANSLWTMVAKALRQYRREHNKLPARIILYRDGLSAGSLKQVFEYEVKEIVEKLDEEYKRAKAEKPPMFAYIVVTKAINTRFFELRNHQSTNPPPGTVVDDVVTFPERYDFYLVSQSVRQGTVSPTSYNVLYSNIRLSPDQIQKLTYKMTHLYYNWSGTTRVPAVCQYAKKLATMVATNLHQIPQNALEKKFYYL